MFLYCSFLKSDFNVQSTTLWSFKAKSWIYNYFKPVQDRSNQIINILKKKEEENDIDKGNDPEHLHVEFCPNKQRSFEPFMSLDFTKPQVKSWITILDTTQSTVEATKRKTGNNKHVSIFYMSPSWNRHKCRILSKWNPQTYTVWTQRRREKNFKITGMCLIYC